MARPKRVESNGNGSSAVARNVLADVPSIEDLEIRLSELAAEAARVERLLACLRTMETPHVSVVA